MKTIDLIYKIAILIKAIEGFLQAIAGFILLLVSSNKIIGFIRWIYRYETIEDPKDFLANLLINSFTGVMQHSKIIIGIILVISGLVKLLIVISLLSKKIYLYITAEIILILLLIYEFYRFYFSNSRIFLIAFLFDLLIAILVVYEHRKQLKRLIKENLIV